MKEKLIEAANNLADLAAEYEEKITQKSWMTDGWKDLIDRIREYDRDFQFDHDSDPTEVLHEVFLRVQELEGKKQQKLEGNWAYYFNPFVAERAAEAQLQQQMQAQAAQLRQDMQLRIEPVNPFLGRPEQDANPFIGRIEEDIFEDNGDGVGEP